MRMGRALVIMIVALAFCASTRGYAQDDSASVYKSKCQICHGPDGKGDTPAGKKIGAKDLHTPEVSKQTDAELFGIVKKGKDKMPAYASKLSDDQINDLIKYIRSLK